MTLTYFYLEPRKKGLALISKMCGMTNCGSPLAYISEHGLTLSGRHGKTRIDKGTLTLEDLEKLVEIVREKRGTMTGESEERAA